MTTLYCGVDDTLEYLGSKERHFNTAFQAIKIYGGSPFDIDVTMTEELLRQRLPFDKCYFEFCDENGRSNLAFIVEEVTYGKNDYDHYITMFLRPLSGGWRIVPCNIEYTANGKLLLDWSPIGKEVKGTSVIDDGDLSLESLVESQVLSFYKLLNVLNCSNVELIDNEVRKKVNNRRKKKGKLPFFEYKTLHIQTSKKENKNKSGLSGTDRRSPRVHLRRGHIRHLQSGKTTWVQPCIIGSEENGVIDKDYHIH